MAWTDWLDDIDIIKTIVDIGSKAFGSGDDDEPTKGFVTRNTATTKFGMPEAPTGYKGYITGSGVQTARSRQAMTQLERLMEIRNKSMQTGVDALANRYIRDAINSNNSVSGKKLFGTSVTGGTGAPNIALGSTKIS